MHRLTFCVLLILVAVAELKKVKKFERDDNMRRNVYRSRYQERSFQKLSRTLINTNKKVKQLCEENTSDRTSEHYRPYEYVLFINVADMKKDKIDIKSKYRVLYISVEDDDAKTYFELRILPEIVDITKAWWNIQNGTIVIVIPYKQSNGKTMVPCDEKIDDRLILIPRREKRYPKLTKDTTSQMAYDGEQVNTRYKKSNTSILTFPKKNLQTTIG